MSWNGGDASGFRPIEPTKGVLSPQQYQAVILKLSDCTLEVPEKIELPWYSAALADPWETAHSAVHMCAIGCQKMGLRTEGIERAVRAQRDAIIRLENIVTLPRNAHVAAERIDFLSHRHDPPQLIADFLLLAVRRDAEMSIYMSVRCLGRMCTKTVLNPVDVHEAVRRVRERLGHQGGGERTIWMPT